MISTIQEQEKNLTRKRKYEMKNMDVSATYILCMGETRKQLKVRMSQHRGTSFRTGIMLNSVEKSKMLDHSFDSGHFTSENNFKILDSCQPFNLRILKSIYIYIYIHKIKLSLNDHDKSGFS